MTSEHDFFATHESLRLREQLDGVTVRRVRLYDEPESASVDGIVSAMSRALGPRTRALALTWVHSSSGVKLPAARDRRRGGRREPRAARARAHPPVRRRRARLRRRGRVAGRPRHRRARLRLPQVAVRPARHRASSGRRRTPGAASPHHPVLRPARLRRVDRGPPARRRAARRADDARRLPLVRAPLGAARGREGPRRARRPRGGGAADARPRRGAEGRAGRHRRRPAEDAARRRRCPPGSCAAR